jgi:hypothetical protein
VASNHLVAEYRFPSRAVASNLRVFDGKEERQQQEVLANYLGAARFEANASPGEEYP